MNRDRVKESIKKHEGFSLECYNDTEGHPTVGWGHLLREPLDHPITEKQAELWFEADFAEAVEDAKAVCETKEVPWHALSDARKEVLVEMAFNLGRTRLSKFNRAFAALSYMNWPEAARELMDSKWANQVGNRAVTLAAKMSRDAQDIKMISRDPDGGFVTVHYSDSGIDTFQVATKNLT